MIALVAAALAAPCEVPTPIAAIGSANTRARTAFRAANQAELDGAVADATTLLTCVREQLTTSDVGSLYRTFALGTFVARDRSGTLAWFMASRAAEPTFAISDATMAASHPFRRLYDGTEAEPSPNPLDVSDVSGWIRVDGRRADTLPTTRPYVVQQFSSDGDVLLTALVLVGERIELIRPEEPLAPEPEIQPVEVVAPPPSPPIRSSRGLILAVGAGAAWIDGPTGLYLQLQPQVRIPVGKVLDIDVAAPVSWTRAEQFYVVPMLRAGLTWSPDLGRTRPWLGAAATVGFYNPKGPLKTPVMPGGVVLLGLDHDLGTPHLLIDAMGGWVGRATVSATVGVGVEL